ncbi:MAG TPA: hypothetical protein VL401_02195 [Alphaproteobacteria bacterium]|jgi:hypothetical protein|nr:hypothetical protein [Alphaproteobacteria bacterium]
MSKQINFFFSEVDRREFVTFVFSQSDKVISDKGEILDFDKACDSSFYITNPDSKIYKRNSGFIDVFPSEVIEFSKGAFKEKQKDMWESRLYLKTQYYDKNDELVTKPQWLVKKYEDYVKWLKKRVYKSTNTPPTIYIGKQAFELYKQGYKMKNAPKVNIEF